MAQLLFATSSTFQLLMALIYSVSYSSGQSSAPDAGLKLHNELRTKHQVGPLALDGGLNSEAQRCAVIYATNRKIDHSCTTAGAGENLYMAWGSPTAPDPANVTIKAIQNWYNENTGYNYANPGSSSGVTGHFTQVVWKETTLLGIGVATVNTYTVVVGKYKPPGNMMGNNYSYYKANVLPPK